MTTFQLEDLSTKVNEIARTVGTYIREERQKVRHSDIEDKSLNQLVSYVDRTAEARILEQLAQLLPEAGFIAEEGTREGRPAEFQWVVDPLDGTTNFLHGIPGYAVSIALMQGNEVVLGTVYDAARQECFYTWKGAPSYLDGQIISINKGRTLAGSLLATGFPVTDFSRLPWLMEKVSHFIQNSRGVRRLGAAAIDLAYVAAGRFDGFFEYGLSPWDVAAGGLLVQNAGGVVSDFKGGDQYLFGKEILAAGPEVYREMLKCL